MLNEAPMTPGQKKAKAAQTKQQYSTAKGGSSLANLRLKQKGGQQAKQTAIRKTGASGANPQTVDTGPLAVKPGAYSAQNYKATMAKRKDNQKKAAASAAKKTKAVPVKGPNSVATTQKNIATTKKKSDDDVIAKTVKGAAKLAGKGVVGGVKMAGKALKPTKKKFKRIGAAGLGAAAMAVPVVALHMGEGRKMRTLSQLREAKMVTGNETGMMFKVSIEGLPDMIMVGKSPGEIKGQLRKIVKQPSMIQSVARMPKSKVKMMYRDIVSGRDEDE